MDKKETRLSLRFRILFYIALAGIVVCMSYAIYILVDVYRYTSTHPTYAQVCAPLVFIRKADYYNDRTFVVCGSPTTEPVLKEYPR